MEPPKGPKIPKIPKFEMPKAPPPKPESNLPPLPEGVPPKKVPKLASFDPNAPKPFLQKHSTLLNLMLPILLVVGAIGFGVYKLFFAKGKKKPGIAAAADAGTSGPPVKVCDAPPGEAPLVVTTDSAEDKALEAAQKLSACVLKAGRKDDYVFQLKPREDGPCDTCPWQLVIRMGDALSGETLDLDPGLDVSGKIASQPSKTKPGTQELKLTLKYVRVRGPEECVYTIKGSMGSFEVVPGDCVTPEEKTDKEPAP